MLTREQIEAILDDEEKSPFQEKNVDHDLRALTLLRERIPYEECKSIIGGADHDILYLCDLDLVEKYFDEADLAVLADCNVMVHDGYLALFV